MALLVAQAIGGIDLSTIDIARLDHTNQLSLPTVEPERFVAAMAMAATTVSVITTSGHAGKFGLTVSAVTSVSAEPPLLLACINRRNRVADAVTRNKNFCINLLAKSQSIVSDVFAGCAGEAPPYDFACAEWRQAATGAPILHGAAASFDCRLENANDAGSHRIIIGRVLDAFAGDTEPLVYARRYYRAIANLKH